MQKCNLHIQIFVFTGCLLCLTALPLRGNVDYIQAFHEKQKLNAFHPGEICLTTAEFISMRTAVVFYIIMVRTTGLASTRVKTATQRSLELTAIRLPICTTGKKRV